MMRKGIEREAVNGEGDIIAEELRRRKNGADGGNILLIDPHKVPDPRL